MKTLNYIKLNESGVANVVSALHQLLADFQVYYTNLRGFHWNIKGHGFFVLHEKFESMYDDAAEKVDEIAERILMLGGVPENKFSEYLKVAKVKEVSDVACGSDAVSNILETYGYLIGEERKIIELANEAGGRRYCRPDDRLSERTGKDGLDAGCFQHKRMHKQIIYRFR